MESSEAGALQISRFWPKVNSNGRQDSSTPVLWAFYKSTNNPINVPCNYNIIVSAYPVIHVQNAQFIEYLVSLHSSKHYSTKEIYFCQRKPFTGRGPWTSNLRRAPNTYKME